MSLVVNFLLAHTLVCCGSLPAAAQAPLRQAGAEQDKFAVKAIAAQEIVVTTATRDSIVDYAKTFLGTPYKYAHASPSSGFDCSGFTWFVFNHFGVAIPRSSKDYASLGKRVTIEEARKGDIILFTGTNPKEKRVGHVGIVISNPGDSLQFIHSSSSDNHFGVVITDYYKSAYPKRFIGICSVLPE